MLNWIGVVVSFAFVFALIGTATLLRSRSVVDAGLARKIIHVGVSHWWIIAMAMIDDPLIASIGPATFIVVNYLSLRLRLFPAMDEAGAGNKWGTVYFPISLLILTLICFSGRMPLYVGGIAMLVLGYGDGLAALVGERAPALVKLQVFGGSKSLSGSLAMLAASTVVAAVFLALFHPAAGNPVFVVGAAFAIAALASVTEVLTPLGLDNLSVPLVTAAFVNWVIL
jgi:phytol kinase